MGEQFSYAERDSTHLTLITLIFIGVLSAFAMTQLDVSELIVSSAITLQSSLVPLELILIWRFISVILGASAIYYMLKIAQGIMPVLLHHERKEAIIRVVGFERFVTFSSWNLLLTIFYFLFAGIASLLFLMGYSIPLWLKISEIVLLTAALGTSFLTATVIRYVVIPEEVSLERNHDNLFQFHNQAMHNFAAIFLAIEIILVQPELSPLFALFGLSAGLIYVAFAYVFAFFGGGYYVYSFIDPRLRYAPLLMGGLAGAIAVFYLGIWLVIQLMSFNLGIGAVFLIIWIALIVQFSSVSFEKINPT